MSDTTEPSFAWKKDRTQKRRNDAYNKKRNHAPTATETEKPNSSSVSKEAEPQPQRANRRDRTEQKPKQVESPSGSASDTKQKEQPVVDHSHLKRETEEIEKLTKKFSKREIASNWHRYSAPQDTLLRPASDDREEDETRADFSDLLQVPSSRGGHLQLKDEQDWSTASGVLGEYFALDLKLLNQSLACISIYDLLQLPKRVFSEEEIHSFNSSADHAKKCYKVEKDLVDPSGNVLQALTSSAAQEVVPELIQENESNPEEVFNILDFKTSKQKLLDLDMNLGNDKYTNESLIEDVKNFENVVISVNSSRNNTQKDKKQVMKEHYDLAKSSEKTVESFNRDLNMGVNDEDTNEGNTESQYSFPNSSSVNENVEDVEAEEENGILPAKNSSKTEISPMEDPQVSHEEVRTGGSEVDLLKERKKSITSTKNVETDKSLSSAKAFNLEDDDDLDFLLTLKNPVKAKNEKKETPIIIKDSSFLPGSASPSSSATDAQSRSDLDSWLDSVLED